MVKGKGKKTKRFMTIMMVPHYSSKIVSAKISSFYWKLTALVVVAALAATSLGIFIDKTLQENRKLKNDLSVLYDLNFEQMELLVDQGNVMGNKETVIGELQGVIADREEYITDQIDTILDKYRTITDQYIVNRISDSISSRSGGTMNSTEFAAEIDDLQTLLEQLNFVSSDTQSETFDLSGSTSKLENYLSSLPVLWPVNGGGIRDGFGYRVHPITGVRSFHEGVDIAAAPNTDIYAAGGGTVIYSGYDGGYGYCIIIDHGYGISSLYAHCRKLLVNDGDTVEKGEMIAKVGSTGSSTGPHCHFEIQINGVQVNPLKFLDY